MTCKYEDAHIYVCGICGEIHVVVGNETARLTIGAIDNALSLFFDDKYFQRLRDKQGKGG